jgi:FkbM family methyltransferase
MGARRWVRSTVAVAADVIHWLVGRATEDDRPSEYCYVCATPGRRFKMLLSRPGHIEDALVRDGTWEPHVTNALGFFVRDRALFVDVGANIGFHSLWVASAFPTARVIAFEPNPPVAAELRRNLALNALDNLELRQAAVGERSGFARLYAQRARAYNRGNSSLQRNPDLGARYDLVDTPLVALDDVIADPVAVIKIDTEGGELQVLAGARRVLAASRPVVLFEFESRYFDDAPAALRAILALLPGYRVWKLSPGEATLVPFDADEVGSRFFRADLLCTPI